ncbi:unnamed protein product [Ilex paraguariensis]|uniref:Uncharacterized protein n=1 Tax=Ilex paraguariensis TaxID=185542 RepID=A0ABC8QSF6_9AQUA
MKLPTLRCRTTPNLPEPLVLQPVKLVLRQVKRRLNGLVAILLSIFFLLSLIGLIVNIKPEPQAEDVDTNQLKFLPSTLESLGAFTPPSRWVSPVVSETTLRSTATMALHRTAYHFQPEKNWMNGRSKRYVLA